METALTVSQLDRVLNKPTLFIRIYVVFWWTHDLQTQEAVFMKFAKTRHETQPQVSLQNLTDW